MADNDGLHLFDENPLEKNSNNNSLDSRYLLFELNNTVMGTPLLDTREVIESLKTQKVPNTTDYFQGIANFRGEVLGIVNLAKMLGFKETESGRGAVIIFDTDHGPLGIEAHNIIGVKDISSDLIEKKPHIKS